MIAAQLPNWKSARLGRRPLQNLRKSPI